MKQAEVFLSKAKDTNSYLARDSVPKLLWRFSVPCVLSMLVSALYNIVDQVFIGQGVGYLGNAATNVVYPFTVLALALALAVGDGCASLLSISLGRGDGECAHKSIGNGIVLVAVVAFFLTTVGFVWEDFVLRIFGVTSTCYGYAKEYLDIILVGLPFYMFATALNGAIRADGSPGYSMISMMVGAVINLILDPVAIFVLDLGVSGAAWATVIGQFVSLCLSAAYFAKAKSFHLQARSFRLSCAVTKSIVQLGVSSFIIQIAFVLVMAVSNNLIVRFGPRSVYGADIILSVIGIVMKVFGIVIAFSVGIAVGGQPIAGYNYGAKNYSRVFEVYRAIIIANVVVGVIATVIFEFFPLGIIRLFGSESELYNRYALLCFRIFLGGISLTCIQKASSIFLQAIGRPLKSTLISLSRDVLFFIPALLILTPLFGVTAMLWAAPAADLLSLLVTVLLVLSEFRAIKMSADSMAEEE